MYTIPNSELCIYLQIKSQINGSACKQMGKIAKKADNHTHIYKIKCFHLVDKYIYGDDRPGDRDSVCSSAVYIGISQVRDK